MFFSVPVITSVYIHACMHASCISIFPVIYKLARLLLPFMLNSIAAAQLIFRDEWMPCKTKLHLILVTVIL